MVVNVPSLIASARSSGRVEKRWQSFLNYQPSTTKLAAAQGPALAQTPVSLAAFNPTLVWTREFEGQDSGRTGAVTPSLYQSVTMTMGQFLSHLGRQKPKKLPHRFGGILITGSTAVCPGDAEATAKPRTSPGKPSRSGMGG
jgi:hypothetical protein